MSLALKNTGQKPVADSLDSAVKQFLSRPEDTPVIDLLRGEWLKVLGEKQQWDEFDAVYPHLRNGDSELACYALQSRRRSQETEALRGARKLWFIGKELPDSCDVLFKAAQSAGIISKQDVSRRLRLALEANNVSFAIQLSAQLDEQYAGLPAMLRSAAADPDRYLRKLTSGNFRSANIPAAQAPASASIESPAAGDESPASAVAAVSAPAATRPPRLPRNSSAGAISGPGLASAAVPIPRPTQRPDPRNPLPVPTVAMVPARISTTTKPFR